MTPLEQIEYSRSLYNEQVKKVKKETYVQNLLFEDYVNQVTKNTPMYDYCGNIFDLAAKEIGKKYKKERRNLEFLTDRISEDFLDNNEIKITSIYSCGYETYGWSIRFVLFGVKYSLTIPVMKNINVSNFTDAHYGKFVLFKEERDHIWQIETSSYDIKDISKYISEWINSMEVLRSE